MLSRRGARSRKSARKRLRPRLSKRQNRKPRHRRRSSSKPEGTAAAKSPHRGLSGKLPRQKASRGSALRIQIEMGRRMVKLAVKKREARQDPKKTNNESVISRSSQTRARAARAKTLIQGSLVNGGLRLPRTSSQTRRQPAAAGLRTRTITTRQTPRYSTKQTKKRHKGWCK